jgi:hypothetical protein
MQEFSPAGYQHDFITAKQYPNTVLW